MHSQCCPNVLRPAKFKNEIQDVMLGITELLELTRECELPPVLNSVSVYTDEIGKAAFQVARQYARPTEFLQTLLDIIRVKFEPCVLGTFFLNSNMDFLYDEVPEDRFQLAYASVTSEAGEGFSTFWSESVAAHLEICGYDLSQSTAMYAVPSTGEERYAFGLDREVADALVSGFSVDEAVALLASSVSSNISNPKQAIYSGYCMDPWLHDRISLSLGFFLRKDERSRN